LAKKQLYFRLKDGNTVDREYALQLRDELTILRAALADELAAALADERITIQQWLDRMQAATEDVYATEYLLGRGGVNAMEDVDYGWLDEQLAPVFTTLTDLAGRIADGMYSEAQIANFTRNTIEGGTIGYEGGNARAYGVDPRLLPAMPTQGSPCRERCHCFWSHDVTPEGVWVGSTWMHPPIDRRIPGYEPCDVCWERINTWNPWVPPNRG
jgi:hypothetical protein